MAKWRRSSDRKFIFLYYVSSDSLDWNAIFFFLLFLAGSLLLKCMCTKIFVLFFFIVRKDDKFLISIGMEDLDVISKVHVRFIFLLIATYSFILIWIIIKFVVKIRKTILVFQKQYELTIAKKKNRPLKFFREPTKEIKIE